MFQQIEFEEACKELVEPIVDGYEFFTESHDVKIYRQYNEQSGLYQYKIYGGLPDVSPEVCAKVYMDVDYRRVWDTYVNELEEVSQEGGQTLLYWQVNFPWPMSNRDYIYCREMKEFESQLNGQKMWVVLARGDPNTSIPERSGVIRVTDYIQSMAIMSDGNVGTKAFMHYYDNPGGMIPTWLINWGAKTGVPQFLTIMQKACRGYDEYLRDKEQQQSS